MKKIMDMTKLQGIFPALMIAFQSSGKIDVPKIQELVHTLDAAGVNGLYVGGSSAEMVLCSSAERMELLECTLDACPNKPIIAHIGALSTAESVMLTRHASNAGAAAISSVTPLYFKYSFAEIKHFYAQLCAASDVPLIIYNIPALSGSTLTYDQLCELLSLEGVGGMKFTSSDFFCLNRLKNAFPDKLIYNGCDEMLLSGLSAGADGGIGTTYNFMPELMVKIYSLFRQARIEEAGAVQSFANRIIAEVVRLGVLPASKQMIAYSGIEYGICREPFLPLTSEAKSELYELAWKPLADYLERGKTAQ